MLHRYRIGIWNFTKFSCEISKTSLYEYILQPYFSLRAFFVFQRAPFTLVTDESALCRDLPALTKLITYHTSRSQTLALSVS